MELKMENTPVIKIGYNYQGNLKEIYAKLEYYNFSGSIKDRVALYIIKNAIKRGELKENMTIYEATSGNTGISLAAIGKLYGYNMHIFMPNWVSIERRKIMEMYGAKVTLVSKEEGGFKKAIQLAKEQAEINHGFLSNQFENEDNVLAHYETTGKEILEQVENIGGFTSRNRNRGDFNWNWKKIKRI